LAESAGRIDVRRSAFAEQNPQTVKKLLRATAKGYQDAMANPKEAAAIMAKYMMVPERPDVLDRQVEATVVTTNAPAGKPSAGKSARLGSQPEPLERDRRHFRNPPARLLLYDEYLH